MLRLSAALLTLLLLAACTSSAPRADRSPSPTPGTASATALATPRPTVVVDVLPKTFGGGFASPSGNIVCDIHSRSVTCSVRDQPWRPMPIDEECTPGQWETVVQLQLTSTASLQGQCARPSGGAPLGYGHAIQVGTMRCGMTTKGLECLVMGTGQGFFVSKSSYRLTAQGSTLASAPAAATTGVTTVPDGIWGWFASPSGNLQCSLSKDSAQCIVLEHTWKLNDKPEPCEDEGVAAVVEAFVSTSHGNIYSTCRSEREERSELAYGRGYRIGDLQCRSLKNGMECTNVTTKHGFFVSTANYRTF